jgi:hypothetical protein
MLLLLRCSITPGGPDGHQSINLSFSLSLLELFPRSFAGLIIVYLPHLLVGVHVSALPSHPTYSPSTPPYITHSLPIPYYTTAFPPLAPHCTANHPTITLPTHSQCLHTVAVAAVPERYSGRLATWHRRLACCTLPPRRSQRLAACPCLNCVQATKNKALPGTHPSSQQRPVRREDRRPCRAHT